MDERGLPDATRQLFNKELLDFILDDLMPWHRIAGMRDFSLLEVNRYCVEFSENYSLGGCLHVYLKCCGCKYYIILYCNFRGVTGIKGFTREILIALAADIESREWRSQHNHRLGIPAPHPRSCTTDDVECFFSIMRDSIGKDFTLKQVCHCTLIWVMIILLNHVGVL